MRHTILVIDDQWSMQELIRVVLQTAGYRVLLAGDGVTGLSLARTEHPDAIVMDLRIPGIDGADLLRGLHTEPRTANIPVVLITFNPAAEQLSEMLRAGASSYLRKPFSPPALVRAIERVLKRREMPIAV